VEIFQMTLTRKLWRYIALHYAWDVSSLIWS
jgi:hypothetical protein